MSSDRQLHLYLLAAPRRPWHRPAEAPLELLLGTTAVPLQIDLTDALDASPSEAAVSAGAA
jgi:hypothetical protein